MKFKRQYVRLFCSILLVFVVLLSGCQSSAPVTVGDLESLTAVLDENIPGWLNRYGVPGASLALVVDGELVWSQGYGWADVEEGVAARPETVYQVASISKPVTAWGVMRLAEAGEIDLDAPISETLTRWELPASGYSAEGVTIRRLLSHSAGLSVHGYPGYLPDALLPTLEESLSGAGGTAYHVQQVSEAGKQFSYSGGGYTLLQLMIEEVSGMGFSEFMQAEVLSPLGMDHSSFEWDADLHADTAIGYDARGRVLPNYLFTEKAAAGLYTTAAELARFGAAALPGNNGEAAGRGVISPEGVKTLFAPAIAMPEGGIETYLSGMDAYGLGYFLETLPDGSQWYSHTGGNKGWRSLLIIDPKQSAVLVVLTNSDNGGAVYDEVTKVWAKWLGSGTPTRFEHLQIVAYGVAAVSILVLLGLVGWTYRFARSLLEKKRSFRFKFGWKALGKLQAALLLGGLWWGEGTLLKFVLPGMAGWAELVFLLWAAAMVMSAFTVSGRHEMSRD
ncbi:MAG: penicillin-binding protein [Chloroflexi bacterium HGW-Chloroflexi-10]|nr:MAG: penicillin-binding protein [Chloroflexi bacterium HGW-Chloroflexi-10]